MDQVDTAMKQAERDAVRIEESKKETKKVYASDDDLSDDQLEHISWRMDPSTSMSDWTIELVHATVLKKVFHVHTALLAVGYKKSQYFARLFAGRFSESVRRTSRIELEPEQIAAFPHLLDFVYSPTGKLNATTSNIMVLYNLGQYFEMTGLRREARKFWERDMTVETWPEYYQLSQQVSNEKLAKSVYGFWAHKIESFHLDYVALTDYDFWIRIIGVTRCCIYHQRQLSKVVARFCRLNASTLNKEHFECLTNATVLPECHAEAVIDLLQAEKLIVAPDEIEDEGSDLQVRCLRAIRNDWRTLEAGKGSFLLEELSKCNPDVLSKVMITLLTAAKKTTKSMQDMMEAYGCSAEEEEDDESSSSSSYSSEDDSDDNSEGDY